MIQIFMFFLAFVSNVSNDTWFPGKFLLKVVYATWWSEITARNMPSQMTDINLTGTDLLSPRYSA